MATHLTTAHIQWFTYRSLCRIHWLFFWHQYIFMYMGWDASTYRQNIKINLIFLTDACINGSVKRDTPLIPLFENSVAAISSFKVYYSGGFGGYHTVNICLLWVYVKKIIIRNGESYLRMRICSSTGATRFRSQSRKYCSERRLYLSSLLSQNKENP